MSTGIRNAAITALCFVAARAWLHPLWSRIALTARYFQGLGSGSTIERSGEFGVIDAVARAGVPKGYFDVGGLIARVPGAMVHVFEPSRALAKEIADGYRGGSVIVNECGLSDRAEALTLVAPQEGATTSTLHPSVEGQYQHVERIQRITLDTYCERHSIPEIGLLKVDVEGHELKALQGATRMLGAGAIHMIQFDGGAAVNTRILFADFWQLLTGFGYEIYRVLPYGRVRIPVYREQDECCLLGVSKRRALNTRHHLAQNDRP